MQTSKLIKNSLILLITLNILIIIVLAELSLFSPRPCGGKTFIGCYLTINQPSENAGYYLFLRPDRIEQAQGEVFLVTKYPLFAGLSVPLRFRAGVVDKEEYLFLGCETPKGPFSPTGQCKKFTNRSEVAFDGQLPKTIWVKLPIKFDYPSDTYVARCGQYTKKLVFKLNSFPLLSLLLQNKCELIAETVYL